MFPPDTSFGQEAGNNVQMNIRWNINGHVATVSAFERTAETLDQHQKGAPNSLRRPSPRVAKADRPDVQEYQAEDQAECGYASHLSVGQLTFHGERLGAARCS
jgi:hypothetical protein